MDPAVQGPRDDARRRFFRHPIPMDPAGMRAGRRKTKDFIADFWVSFLWWPQTRSRKLQACVQICAGLAPAATWMGNIIAG
jgi:hypothetical protein